MSRFSKSMDTTEHAAPLKVSVEQVEHVSGTEATAIVSVEEPDGSTTEHEVGMTGVPDEAAEPVKQKRRLGRRKNKGNENG